MALILINGLMNNNISIIGEKMYKEIEKCRVSGSKNLISVVNLGEQYLTGVFPKNTDSQISRGPLELVWCPDSYLLQMKQSYSSDEMYLRILFTKSSDTVNSIIWVCETSYLL